MSQDWAPNPPPRVLGFGPISLAYAALILAIHAAITWGYSPVEAFELQIKYGFFTSGGLLLSPDGLTGPWIMTFWSSTLLHGDWTHAGMNAAFLTALGSIHEKRRGWLRFLGLIILAAPLSCLAELIIPASEPKLVIGVSGTGFALLGAILTLRRGGLGKSILVILGVILVTGLAGHFGLFGFELAWLAHLGGFAFGVAYTWIDLRLSFPPRPKPPQWQP